MVYEWLNFIQLRLATGLYPPRCMVCDTIGDSGRDLCSACCQSLPWNQLACPCCALPLPAGLTQPILCAHCLREPPVYDAAWSLFRYVEPLRFLHRRLKYQQRLSHGRLLGDLLANALDKKYVGHPASKPDRIIVMPLHPSRLRSRGFNQSLELIRPAATRLNIPLDVSSCRRIKATAAQTGLPANQRKRNVKGAFACKANLAGQSVVIFDDIVTTGHTVAELARVVKRAGAKRIEVWSLARA